MKGDLQTDVGLGRWVVQQQLTAFWKEVPARYSDCKTGSLNSPSLVSKAWDSPWRAPCLQSTLDSQRNWSLLSMRDGGNVHGGSRVDVLTSKKGRQASKHGFSPGSLYIWVTAGRLFSPQLIPFKKKKIPT